MTNAAGQTYIGRTSGFSDPYSIIMRRASGHAYFSALNTNSFGSDLAMKLGYAHEFYSGNPSVEFRMDIFNNRIGRNIALSNPFISNTQLGNLIYNATANGHLRMIYNNRLILLF